MTDHLFFSRFVGVALTGSVMIGSLLGCQPTTDTVVSEVSTPVDDHSEHDHSEHDHTSKSVPFQCKPEATIGVFYHNDSTPQTVHLLIDGIEYDLTATSDLNDSTGKKIYMSDIGLDDTHGIIWQVNGNNAMLLNKTLDSNVSIEEEEVIFNCHPS